MAETRLRHQVYWCEFSFLQFHAATPQVSSYFGIYITDAFFELKHDVYRKIVLKCKIPLEKRVVQQF